MPNKKAKNNKRKKRILNETLSRQGRTSKQYKKYLKKDVENDLNNEITTMESEWGDDPKSDYLFHIITGVQKAIDIVKKAQSKELLELDKWAQSEMRKELCLKGNLSQGEL